MKDVGLRLSIVLLASLATVAVVWGMRILIERNRRRTPSPEPESETEIPLSFLEEEANHLAARVHILAFSSEDCRQYYTLQLPVLRRIQEIFDEAVTVTEIDAPTSPAFTQRYRVLTIPTTVLLDARGKTHAINYGFTNAQSLSRQVEEILAQDSVRELIL